MSPVDRGVCIVCKGGGMVLCVLSVCGAYAGLDSQRCKGGKGAPESELTFSCPYKNDI